MKRLVMVAVMVLAFVPLVFGASFPVNLEWDANSEPDMKEYRIYRTDGVRVIVGTAAHPVTTIGVTVSVPDGSEGAVKFVATAVDLAGNESGDSNEVSRPFDYKPPVAVKNLR